MAKQVKLEITFTGICMFVKDYKHVLLLDATQARVAKNNSNVIIPAHFAYIRIPESSVLQPPPNKVLKPPAIDTHLKNFRFEYVDPVSGKRAMHVVCFLDQVQITTRQVVVSTHKVNKKKPPAPAKYPDPKKPSEAETLYWVADMSDIHEEAAYVDEGFLSDQPPRTIASFMKLDGASVKCNRVPNDHSWAFQPPLTTFNRALAIGVAAEMTLENNDGSEIDEVQLLLKSFDAAESGREFIIRLKAPENNDPLKLTVGNSPLDAIMQKGHKHSPINGVVNYDFELFYELSKRRPSVFPIPVCQASPYKRKDLGSENCPPASSKP